jgi:hypothetical protein
MPVIFLRSRWRSRKKVQRSNTLSILRTAAFGVLTCQIKWQAKSLGYLAPDTDRAAAEVIWLHALAIGFSRRYLAENADGLTIDWPRIPLPDTRDRLDSSAALGRRMSALLDTESGVQGVTTGSLAKHYRVLGSISSSGLKVNAG